jgi:hypothetical protein
MILNLALIFSAGLTAVFLIPIYSWYYFGTFYHRQYFRKLYPMIGTAARLLITWLRTSEYRSVFSIPLSAPPMLDPDPARVRIRETWPVKDDTCNGCIKCCTRLGCTMMDSEMKRCLCYGSFFWRYFNCGRYPSSARQIRYYQCEKWECIDS